MRAQHLFVATMAGLLTATSVQASVEINANPTKNMNCSAGVCAPTAKNAVLNATDLANMLATSDVKVVTGSGAVTITVSGSFSWTSAHRLTLDAYYNVSLRAPIVVAGRGALTITTNDGGSGGDLIFFDGGHIDFWDKRSSVVINSGVFKLAGNLEELANDIATNPSSSFALANDYNAQTDGTYGVAPITTAFTGVFEGLGHTISNLSINDAGVDRNVGMFAQIYGTVRDFKLVGVIAKATIQSETLGTLAGANGGAIIHVSATGNISFVGAQNNGGLVGVNSGHIEDCSAAVSALTNSAPRLRNEVPGSRIKASGGGLVGYNGSGSSIENSYAEGNVIGAKGQSYGGGLVGYNYGTISNSHATGAVSQYGAAGGLVGYNSYQIAYSYAAGEAGGGNESGGLVGVNKYQISNSFATGEVSGRKESGGLVGQNDGTIDGAYAMGTVTGGDEASVGGLVGANRRTIENGYAMGMVIGGQNARVGGLVGLNALDRRANGTIMTSYSTGTLSGAAGSYVGGVIGYDQNGGASSNAYWDLDTSGIDDPGHGAGNLLNDPGLVGLSDLTLKSGLPAGFAISTWAEADNINGGYPYLISIPPD